MAERKRSGPPTTTGCGVRRWNHKMLMRNHRELIVSVLRPCSETQPVVVPNSFNHNRLYLNAYDLTMKAGLEQCRQPIASVELHVAVIFDLYTPHRLPGPRRPNGGVAASHI